MSTTLSRPLIPALLLLALGTLPAQETGAAGAKDELRYRLREGETLLWSSATKLAIEIQEMPEEFEGLLTGEAIDIEAKFVLALEVKAVEDGRAQAQATFKKLSAHGNLVMEELDFEYDAEKPPEKKEGDGSDDDPGFGLGVGEMLQELVRKPLDLIVDPLGRARLASADSLDRPSREFLEQFLTPNGFMGPLPEKEVGKGDRWPSTHAFKIPNLPLSLKILSENEYVERVESGGTPVASVRAAYKVEAAEEEAEVDPIFSLKAKIGGKGEGELLFEIDQGLPSKQSHKVVVDVDADLENPSTGENMKIKATLTVTHEGSIRR